MPGENEEVVIVPTVIPELERTMDANWGLLSEETKAQLTELREKKINAAKEFIKENKGVLDKPATQSKAEGEEEEEEEDVQETPEQKKAREDAEKNETPEQKKAREDAEKAKTVEIKENAFGIKIAKKNGKKSDVVIEKAEDIVPTIEKLYGQKLKDLTELPKHFEAVNKWRADAQKLPELEKTATAYKGLLEGLPPHLLDTVKAFWEGKDYNEVWNNRPAFDYKVAVDKQDVKKLINHYFKGKFTEEQLETIGTDKQEPAVEIAIQASKDKYSTEKEKHDNQIATYTSRAQEQVKLFTASVDGSIGHLKQSFPEVDPAAEARVKQTLSGGPQAILSHFCNADGSYKQGAAEMLLLALDGKSVMLELMNAAERAAESRVNEEIVSRGAEKQNGAGKRTGADGKVSPEAKEKLEALNKLKKPVHY